MSWHVVRTSASAGLEGAGVPGGDRFRASYADLEARMKALAEADGDVFLPNIGPPGPVEYVFICMEPSLGRWARSPAEAKAKSRGRVPELRLLG